MAEQLSHAEVLGRYVGTANNPLSLWERVRVRASR
jgi:hypothetical protein